MTIAEPQWKFTASVYLKRHHCMLYRDEYLGIQKQIMTRRNDIFITPKERVYFFIDGISEVFHSEERMLQKLLKITSEDSFSSSR